MDNRTLKPVFGQTEELYSYCVSYLLNGEMMGMYVWASSTSDAKRELNKRTPKAKITDVKLGWPR